MGLLTSSTALTQYSVKGTKIDAPNEWVQEKLEQFVIDDEKENISPNIGWTSLEAPYSPSFSGRSYIISDYYIFSFRVDKKTVPHKAVKKYSAIEENRIKKKLQGAQISRTEKKDIKNHVIDTLLLRTPSIPNVFEVVWNYSESRLWFLSQGKEACTLFTQFFNKTFDQKLVPLFPYLMAQESGVFTRQKLDEIEQLRPTSFIQSIH